MGDAAAVAAADFCAAAAPLDAAAAASAAVAVAVAVSVEAPFTAPAPSGLVESVAEDSLGGNGRGVNPAADEAAFDP